ncbi:helix-turn-helix transcriptional regulator [Candidatus Poribacteria bacterium]|nr:helix-turn-helix transcriptional regulator [Candidatus Poribacteria bacterium]
MKNEKRTTTDAVEILHHLYIKDDPKRIASLEAEEIKSKIAQHIYDLRESAGLTQKQLSQKIGTTAKIIDNLEITDYEDNEIGDAILMLQRIAKALDKQIEFRIVPLRVAPTKAPPQPQPVMS